MTTIRALWLMPLPEVERVGSERNDTFVIRPSQSVTSGDKFRPYYLPSTTALVDKLLKEFERFDRGSFPGLPMLR